MSGTTANRIEVFRNVAGLSRAGLADRLGVTERTVFRWERGEVEIPDRHKLALSALFEVRISFLMGWENGTDAGPEAAVA